MAPSPETQTSYMEDEEHPLLGTRSPVSKTGIQEKTPKQGFLKKKQGPDGLLSWAVAFANFLINLCVVGLGRMSGILYVVLMKKFKVDRETASTPFSVQQAARNLFGPLAGILGQKYGVRNVTVVGGFIGVISAVTCYFATDMNWITVMWGLIFGICTALTTTLNQVPIDQYFEKHRTTAGGLAFSGGCVGAFFFPVVLEALLARYGVPGTFLCMGAVLLVVVPAALFLGEPPWKKKKKTAVIGTGDGRNYSTFQPPPRGQKPLPAQLRKADSRKTANGGTLVQSSPGKSAVDFAFLHQYCETVYQLFALTVLTDDVPPDSDMDWTSFETEPLVYELQSLHNFLRMPSTPKGGGGLSDSSGSVVDELTHSVHEIKIVIQEETSPVEADRADTFSNDSRWVFITSKLHDLANTDEDDVLSYFPVQLHAHVLQVLHYMKALSREVEEMVYNAKLEDVPSSERREGSPQEMQAPEGEVKDNRGQNQGPNLRSNSFLEHLKTAVLLHKNPLFLLICLCRGVFMLTFIPMVTIVVDFAVDQGLTQDTGKYVIATLSLGDLLGRLCLGWVTDSGCLSLSRYMLLVMVLLGGSTASLPYMHSEVSLMPAVLVFGMLQGSLFVRHQILVSKYMGDHEQAIGMGFINLLSGFIGFTLPSYIGYFRDVKGSYDGMFYVNGIICACVGLLWVMEPYFVRFTSKGKSDKYQELVSDTGLR